MASSFTRPTNDQLLTPFMTTLIAFVFALFFRLNDNKQHVVVCRKKTSSLRAHYASWLKFWIINKHFIICSTWGTFLCLVGDAIEWWFGSKTQSFRKSHLKLDELCVEWNYFGLKILQKHQFLLQNNENPLMWAQHPHRGWRHNCQNDNNTCQQNIFIFIGMKIIFSSFARRKGQKGRWQTRKSNCFLSLSP